jgi:hypothetical protein
MEIDMRKVLLDYLCKKVIEDIRQGTTIDDKLLISLNEKKYVQTLRNLVEDSDISILMQMTESSDRGKFLIAINLVRKFVDRPEIKNFLKELWQKNADYERRLVLMWRILDDEELNKKFHEEIYNFVKNNFSRFSTDCADWHGGADRVLESCKLRLSDQSFPRTKDWAYLCIAIGSSNKYSIVKLLKSYESNSDAFVRKVSTDLLSYLGFPE